MTKDVLVSISGMHMGITEPQPDEGDEPIEVVTPASYYCRNGKHYIIYDEVMEGMAGNDQKQDQDYRRRKCGDNEKRSVRYAYGIREEQEEPYIL